MPDRAAAKSAARTVAREAAIGYVALVIVLFGGAYLTSHRTAQHLRNSQIAGCERGKQDRLDHVRVYAAMSRYYSGVTKAVSVQHDVKVIAARIRDELNRSADGQRSRIFLCGPLIDDGKQIPDRQALRAVSR